MFGQFFVVNRFEKVVADATKGYRFFRTRVTDNKTSEWRKRTCMRGYSSPRFVGSDGLLNARLTRISSRRRDQRGFVMLTQVPLKFPEREKRRNNGVQGWSRC